MPLVPQVTVAVCVPSSYSVPASYGAFSKVAPVTVPSKEFPDLSPHIFSPAELPSYSATAPILTILK